MPTPEYSDPGTMPMRPQGMPQSPGVPDMNNGVDTRDWDLRRVQELLQRQQQSNVGGTTIASPYSTFQAQPGLNYGDAYNSANANAGQVYGQQQQFVQALQRQAAGQGPSAAAGLLNQAQQQNMATQAGAVASNRNLSPAQQARMQMESGAQTQNATAGQAATMRSQEQLNAQGMLGGQLGMMGSQQLGAAGQFGQMANAQNLGIQGLNQSTAMGNLNANIAQQHADVEHQNANNALLGAGIGAAGSLLSAGAMFFDHGGPVPGKPKAAGDSPKNDTVEAKLSPGEIVIPRSIAQAEDAPERAAEFVRAIRRKKQSESGEGYGKLLELHRQMGKLLESSR